MRLRPNICFWLIISLGTLKKYASGTCFLSSARFLKLTGTTYSPLRENCQFWLGSISNEVRNNFQVLIRCPHLTRSSYLISVQLVCNLRPLPVQWVCGNTRGTFPGRPSPLCWAWVSCLPKGHCSLDPVSAMGNEPLNALRVIWNHLSNFS